jgi:O-antigen/teichoic acid export membrane protein
MLPFQRIVDPVRSVLFPLFAEVQHQRERVAALWLRSTRAIAALLFPALIGLLVVADDLVATFLGPPWEPAIPVLRVLAATGLVQTLIAINSVVLSALGKVDALLRFSVFTFAAAVTGFLVGVQFGITGVAVGYLAANLLVVPPYLRLTSNAVGTSVLALPRAVAGAAGVAAAMAVAVVTARLLLEAAGVAAPLRLGACVVLGAAIVAWLLARRVPALRADVESALRSAKNRTGSVVASS